MVVYGGTLVLITWPQRSVSLGIRMSLPYLAVPMSGLLMFLHAVAIAMQGERPFFALKEGRLG
jgi:TRAP-type C4-dicarboxylate transport system permease small subunit